MKIIFVDPSKVNFSFKGFKFDGFIDDSFVGYTPPIVEATPPHRYSRSEAISRLWQGVVKSLDIRHPDPSVRVTVHATYDNLREDTLVGFILDNLRDTTNPDRRLGCFRHNAYTETWPGERAAQLFIAGLWSLYLQHEALELTRYKQKTACSRCVTYDPSCDDCARANMVEDAHDPMTEHQRKLNHVMYDGVEHAIAVVIGDHAARQLISESRDRALQEVENEMHAWEPGT